MSSTPSTADPRGSYTVVGSPKAPESSRVGLLVVNRSSRINRESYLDSISRSGFTEILLVEQQANSFTVETQARAHPDFRFLLLSRDMNAGEQINAGLHEMSSDYVLVLWSTMVPVRVTANSLSRAEEWRALVMTPLLRNESGGVMPSVYVPEVHRRNVDVRIVEPRSDGAASLLPADYAGLYDRRRFINIGGYDGKIGHSY